MKNNKLYKYINLLTRIVIGILAILFILFKIKDDFLINYEQVKSDEINYGLIVITALLLFFNWGLEALKWQYGIRKIESISFFKSFKIVLGGITLGLLTPNRIGEIPGRALFLNKDIFKELTLKTLVTSFGQVIITLLLGGCGLLFTYQHFNISNPIILIIALVFGTVISLLVYFKVNKLELIFNRIKYLREKEVFTALSSFSFAELINILSMSLVRYIVFSLQFYLVLMAMGVMLIEIEEIMLIPVCFMLASFIPTILVSEIGVRGSVALFVFGLISDMDIQIILASVLLWVINVGFPALMGLYNLKTLKIFKED